LPAVAKNLAATGQATKRDKFAAALGVLTFGFCLLTFDLRVLRALCVLWFNVGLGFTRNG
jgi:hypothetical protein